MVKNKNKHKIYWKVTPKGEKNKLMEEWVVEDSKEIINKSK